MAMMQEAGNEAVQRLYLRLAAALRHARPDPFGSPVTVAEIYQELVPYRLVRTDAGFDMNADYEHALLRLLAGEGECVRLEPTSARDAIRNELRSSNPNVGMYREYAGCDVWVVEPAFTPAAGSIFALVEEEAAARAESAAAARASVSPSTEARSGTLARSDAASDARQTGQVAAPARQTRAPAGSGQQTSPAAKGAGERVAQSERVSTERQVRASSGRPAAGRSAAANVDAGGADSNPAVSCVFCDAGLPTDRSVRFCPWCGTDQRKQPCPECGEVMEGDWLFCVTCGTRPAR
jgi:hypothetical protein